MIHTLLKTFFSFCIAFCIISCGSNQKRNDKVKTWMQSHEKIKVLSTIEMIDSLVQEIGGDYVASLALITGQLDPHSYQLVKGDDEKFAVADLIFYNGLTLEHGPSLKKILKEKSNAIALGDLIEKEHPELILQQEGQVDPHLWMDISLWKKNISPIVQALSKADPKHSHIFEKNGKKLEALLEKKHQEIYEMMQAIPEEKRYLVTSHDAFNYFSRSYLSTEEERKNNTWQKRFKAPEGLAPDSQLSSTDIRAIIDHLTQYRIQVLFPESNLSRDSINKIVEAGKSKGLNLTIAMCPLYADAMGPEGQTYVMMISHNAKLIGQYLNNSEPATLTIECEFDAK